jgi:hypothetical protein
MMKRTRKSNELESCSTAELVSKYRDAAAQRGEALLKSNARGANLAFDVMEDVWSELSRRNAVGELRSLLVDEDSGVKLAAASRLLQLLPDLATEVLRELSGQKTLIGLSAAATLEAQRRYGS